MLILFLSIFFFAHLIVAGIRLEKLFTGGMHKNIIGWTLLILFVPFIGTFLYDRRN